MIRLDEAMCKIADRLAKSAVIIYLNGGEDRRFVGEEGREEAYVLAEVYQANFQSIYADLYAEFRRRFTIYLKRRELLHA